MKQRCCNCGWIGGNKDLKMVVPTSQVWGCPKCEQIFFKIISDKESEDANCVNSEKEEKC